MYQIATLECVRSNLYNKFIMHACVDTGKRAHTRARAHIHTLVVLLLTEPGLTELITAEAEL